MDKPLIALIGLVGAGAVAYIVLGGAGAGSPTEQGSGGGTKKQQVSEPITTYTEETTTPIDGMGVAGAGYTINLPPMPTIQLPPLPDPRDWGYGSVKNTKKESKTQMVAPRVPTTWSEYKEQRGAGVIGTPSYTMTKKEVEMDLSKLTLGGFQP